MNSPLQVCLYNTDPESSATLGKALQSLNFVRLICEVATPSDLSNAIQESDINLVFFHLDPKPKAVVEVIDQVSTRFPEVALIAISHETKPNAILAPMRAGCDQFVCEPIDLEDLAAAVSRVASKRFSNNHKSKCICVTGAGGGAGTTSIACNLALEIGSLTDRDCAVVDLDLQFGDIALNFDAEPQYTIYDLAVAGSVIDKTILASTLCTLPCKVAILSRPGHMEQVELVTPDTIDRVIDVLMTEYENVVVDVPRSLNPCTAAVLARADVVLLVCQLLVPSIRNARRYYDALIQMGVLPERIEIVVNRGDGRGGRITLKDVKETIRREPFACVPNDYQFVARSIDFGRPIAALDRNSPVRAAIRKLATKVIADPNQDPQAPSNSKGFFGRLLSK